LNYAWARGALAPICTEASAVKELLLPAPEVIRSLVLELELELELELLRSELLILD